MAGLFRKWAAIAGIVMLAGCKLALPGGGGASAPDGPNPVTGGAIEVTALPDLPGGAMPKAVPAAAVAPPAVPPAAAAPSAIAADPAAAAAPPAPPPAAALPEARKSESQLACEARRGSWARSENGSHACVTQTRDSGKTCTRAGQCQGLCLARSGTCAPFTPLLGCNDILDDSGRRMTQCLQ